MFALVAAVTIPALAFLAIAKLLTPDLKWYNSLKKPTWLLSVFLFDLIWTTIISINGYASYMVWKAGGGFEGEARLPLLVYGILLLLILAWTPAFFLFKSIKWGYYLVLLTSGTTVLNSFQFYRIVPTAGLLYVPLLLWLPYEMSLSYWMVRHNVPKIRSP